MAINKQTQHLNYNTEKEKILFLNEFDARDLNGPAQQCGRARARDFK